MNDIITLGELLIDLTQTATDEQKNGVFTAFPGGAPANVAVAAAKIGAKTGFIGKVGKDSFGKALRETLSREGVDTSALYESDTVPTTLAIVAVDENGEREFSFYRAPGADTQLSVRETTAAFENGMPKILHVGSLSMTNEPSRTACETAVRFARDRGVLISYDPNYRAALWESEEHAVEMMKVLLPLADILKVSEEEMLMLTGTSDLSEGSKALADYDISLVLITLGEKGVFVKCGDFEELVPGFSVTVADTNGAGDTFHGALLAQIAAKAEGERIDEDELRKMIVYANKAASLTCSRHGAIPAMPTAEEVEASLS